jgi:hypothetical protein
MMPIGEVCMVAAELSTDMTGQLVMGQKGHEHRAELRGRAGLGQSRAGAEQSGGETEQGWAGQSRAGLQGLVVKWCRAV